MSEHDRQPLGAHAPLDAEERALAQRLLRGGDAGPPPELDARIRAQAHAAVHTQARPKLRPWVWGLSTAAAAVLALGMLWQTGLPPTSEQTLYRQAPGAPTAAAPTAEQGSERTTATAGADPGSDARPDGRADRGAGARADMDAAAGARDAALQSAPAESAQRKAPDAAKARRPAAFVDQAQEAEPSRGQEAARELREVAAPQPPPAPPAPPPPPTLPAPPAPSAPPASAETMLRTEPALAPPAASAAAQPVLERERAATRREADARTPSQEATSAADSWPEETADAQHPLPPQRTPAQWIAHIEALLEQGRPEEAAEQLDAFQQQYPDHALPEALQRLRAGR